MEHPRISSLLRHHSKIYRAEDVAAVKLVSTKLVNDTLNKAIDRCMINFGLAPPAPMALCVFDPSCDDDVRPKTEEHAVAILVERVTVQLNHFLRQWILSRLRFKFCVRFARRWRCPSDVASTFVFEAKFSVPTRQCPTPQCTACVYFVLDVPDIDRSSAQPIFVPFRYQFEGMHFMYTPAARGHMFEFQEHLLNAILEQKMKLFQRLQF